MSAPQAPVFQSLLAAGRVTFNARVAETLKRDPKFDAHVFGDVLVRYVGPAVEAVAAIAPASAAAVCVALFDAALLLVSQRRLGFHSARHGVVDRVWIEVLPAIAERVAEQPARLVASLCNAAMQLETHAGARAGDWVSGLAALGPSAETCDELLRLGEVLAWRSGMPQFRGGALQALDTIKPELALRIFGASGMAWPQVWTQLHADAWWSPVAELRSRAAQGVEIGSFIGYGGAFSEPPRVRVDERGFVVRSADRCFRLMADVYGATLLPASIPEFDLAMESLDSRESGVTMPRLEGSVVVQGDRVTRLDFSDLSLGMSVGAEALCVFSPYSYAVRVLPRARESA